MTERTMLEIGGDELRHVVAVDRLEHALSAALTNNPRQQFALLDVEALDRIGDVRIALMRAPQIKGDFHEAMFGKLVDMVGEPRCADGRSRGAAVAERGHETWPA